MDDDKQVQDNKRQPHYLITSIALIGTMTFAYFNRAKEPNWYIFVLTLLMASALLMIQYIFPGKLKAWLLIANNFLKPKVESLKNLFRKKKFYGIVAFAVIATVGTMYFLHIQKYNNAETYLKRGDTYYNLNRFVRAIVEYDQAIVADPNRAEAYYSRGMAYYKLEQHDRAIADFDQAIRLDPSRAEAYFYRGDAYYDPV